MRLSDIILLVGAALFVIGLLYFGLSRRAPQTGAKDTASEISIRALLPGEFDGLEGWERVTADSQTEGVSAVLHEVKGKRFWQVDISAMEFIRDDSLEAELRAEIINRLKAVPGVDNVSEQDREIWAVIGTASGKDLVDAAARAIDKHAVRIRKTIKTDR